MRALQRSTAVHITDFTGSAFSHKLLQVIAAAEKLRQRKQMAPPDSQIPSADLQVAFAQGKLSGLEQEAWAGDCPYDRVAQIGLRESWLAGFTVGRIELASSLRR
jgi:hypothetical protein